MKLFTKFQGTCSTEYLIHQHTLLSLQNHPGFPTNYTTFIIWGLFTYYSYYIWVWCEIVRVYIVPLELETATLQSGSLEPFKSKGTI